MALEIMFATHRIVRGHSEPLVQLDDPEAPQEIGSPRAFANQLLVETSG
jgi:hypothetical protein